MKEIDGVLSEDERAILEIEEWLNLKPMTTQQLHEEHKLHFQNYNFETKFRFFNSRAVIILPPIS